MNEQTFTPQTARQWRDFMSYTPPQVGVLSAVERARLDVPEQEAYDDARIAQINSWMIFSTPNLERLNRELRVTTAINNGAHFTARQGLAISGSQTLGKSTAALYLGRRYEEQRRRASARESDQGFAPVAYVPVPASSTPKGLMMAFARYLDLPVAPGANADSIAAQVTNILQARETSLVILDEVQNLRTHFATGKEAASFLKLFTERLAATFMYVGVDLPHGDLFSGTMGAQLRGRVSMQELSPYSLKSEEGREDWVALINAIESELPLPRHQEGMLDPHATLLFDLTGGVIGSLRLLLRRAATAAVLDGQDRLGKRQILETPLDYRAQAALTATRNEQTTKKRAA